MLALSAFQRLPNGRLHGRRKAVSVEQHLAVLISCCAADGLQEAAFVSEETLAVSIKDGYEADLWYIQAFSEQVDSDDDIDVTVTQGVDDLGALDGVNF